MSHLVSIEMENITDLDALEAAAPEFGMELIRGVNSYKWWGHSVGDYPLPAGFTEKELGKCDHVLRVQGNKDAYEIGVVAAKNGKPGYQLLYDFYGTAGRAVQNCVGQKSEHLKQAYATHFATSHWQRKRYNVTQTRQADGTVVVRARR